MTASRYAGSTMNSRSRCWKAPCRIEAADSWFAYIATIDAGDDWTNPDVWIKANPSLGVTVKVEDLKRQVDEAREMPAQQNAIRRLRLNEWTEQATRWIDMGVWADGAEPFNEDELIGRTCYGGLDLARVNDLSSLALVFPPEQPDEKVKVIWRHWCPQEDILRRVRRDRAPYTVWRDQGYLIATEGNTTDFKFLEAEILELATRFNILEIAYDRTFAGELVRNLQDEGITMVEFGQGFISMGPAAAEFMRLLIGRYLTAWRQSCRHLVRLQRLGAPRSCRQRKARQGTLDRTDRRDSRRHHGGRAIADRAGRLDL